MAVMSSQFQKYLENEYKEVMRVAAQNRDLIEVVPDAGQEPPYVTKYLVTYKVPTWVKAGSSVRKQSSTQVNVEIFSREQPPRAHVVRGEVPYHTNWFRNGRLCNGIAWNYDSRIVDYLQFILEVLEFQELRIDTTSAADPEAAAYWVAHRHERVNFPTDTRSLNTSEKPKPRLQLRVRK